MCYTGWAPNLPLHLGAHQVLPSLTGVSRVALLAHTVTAHCRSSSSLLTLALAFPNQVSLFRKEDFASVPGCRHVPHTHLCPLLL